MKTIEYKYVDFYLKYNKYIINNLFLGFQIKTQITVMVFYVFETFG